MVYKKLIFENKYVENAYFKSVAIFRVSLTAVAVNQ